MELSNINNCTIEQMVQNIADNEQFVIDSKGVSKNTLIKINEYISFKKNIKLILICDYNVHTNSNYINNLEVLLYLNKINRLTVINHSSIALSNLKPLIHIESLEEFSLIGFIAQSINLDVLLNFNLKVINLELNATKSIYDILEINKDLKSIRINTIDAGKIKMNDNVIHLKIYKQLLNQESLGVKYPNIKTLQLFNVKKIRNFDFLYSFSSIENLSLRNTNIEFFPKLQTNKLIRLELLMNKKLKNIDSVLCIEELKKIAITGSALLDENVLMHCLNIKGLEQFYFTSPKKKIQSIIEDKIRNKKIVNNFNYFWDAESL
jgi:hypothetical protein